MGGGEELGLVVGGRGRRSFEDILDYSLSGCPETPALCGIQALLPRRAGLRVVREMGEGSFGMVVLAINKKNFTGKWTDGRVRRRHLPETLNPKP